MKINFVKTHPDAVIPTRGSAGAAGFDLTAVSLRRAADHERDERYQKVLHVHAVAKPVVQRHLVSNPRG